MGVYDIPAVIEHILHKTNLSTLSYVGHSMGCAMFFVAMIKHPELNDKIDVMVALAPATSLANMKSPIQYATPFASIIEVCYSNDHLLQLTNQCHPFHWRPTQLNRHSMLKMQAILVLIQIRVFLSNDSLLPLLQRRFCDKNTHNAAFCRNVIFFFAGGDTQNFDLVLSTGHLFHHLLLTTSSISEHNSNHQWTFPRWNFRPYGRPVRSELQLRWQLITFN